MSKLKLSEAAAEILKKSVASGHKEEFGSEGYKPQVKTPGQSGVLEIGTAGHKSTDPNYDFTRGVPRATPPGAKPPAAEPMHKLASQPQETMGRKDLASSPEGDEDSEETIRDRKSGKKPKQTMQSNPGAETKACCKEDIEAMLSGEDLSEEFKEKAAMIFEAAVEARVDEIAEELEQKFTKELLETVEEYKEELSEKLDTYLDYVVEQWMEENKLAVEKGLKTQVVEDFIESLKNVFVEHYIDIPEEKVDMVEELVGKVEDLEEQVNQQILKNIELKKTISEQQKIESINGICEGLTLSQAEKVRSLAKNVEFISEEDFKEKLTTIRESYYSSGVKKQEIQSLNEAVEISEDDATAVVDPVIALYASKISKLTKF